MKSFNLPDLFSVLAKLWMHHIKTVFLFFSVNVQLCFHEMLENNWLEDSFHFDP